jgi:hypothetical protein
MNKKSQQHITGAVLICCLLIISTIAIGFSTELKYTISGKEIEFIPQSNIEIISINAQPNSSFFSTNTIIVNWSVLSGVSLYHLEIDDNIDFSSPEINYTDINQYNYPSNFTEVESTASFTFSISSLNYKKYYIRIRGYTNE